VDDYTLVPAALKYNKDLAWSFTLDDGLVSAYLVAFPYFNGGRVAGQYIDQWGYDQGGDGVGHPGLYYTDGCGNRKPLLGALAINARNIRSGGADHPGYLSWGQVDSMVRGGWDLFNHGYTHVTGRDVDAGKEVLQNNEVVCRRLGYRMNQMVIPGGKDDEINQEGYVRAAFEQGMLAVHGGRFPGAQDMPGLQSMGDGMEDTLRASRLFLSSKGMTDSSNKVIFNEIDKRLHNGEKVWINAFTHGVGNADIWGISLRFCDLSDFFEGLAGRYGERGQDNIWMASFQAVQEYILIRQRLRYQVSKEGKRVFIRMNTAGLPQEIRHKELSFVWKAARRVKRVQCKGCRVESFAAGRSPDAVSGQLINIQWQ
jgi:hypothetical protein